MKETNPQKFVLYLIANVLAFIGLFLIVQSYQRHIEDAYKAKIAACQDRYEVDVIDNDRFSFSLEDHTDGMKIARNEYKACVKGSQ